MASGIKLPKSDIVWMAGFFDGEGSISLSLTNKKTLSFSAKVAVTNVVPTPIVFFQQCFPHSYIRWRSKYNLRTIHEWSVVGDAAMEFLNTILPYLRIKGPQTALALEYLNLPWRSHGNTSGGKRILRTREQKLIDFEYGIRMAGFNAKGSRNAAARLEQLKQQHLGDITDAKLMYPGQISMEALNVWKTLQRNEQGQFRPSSS